MSHGASAAFADEVTLKGIVKAFPELKELADKIEASPVYKAIDGLRVDLDVETDLNELSDDFEPDDLVAFWNLYVSFCSHFSDLTDAQLTLHGVNPDDLDGYAEISGRYWDVTDWLTPKPEVAKAQKRGLEINRGFFAVYG